SGDSFFAQCVIRGRLRCAGVGGGEDGPLDPHPEGRMRQGLRYHPCAEQRAIAETFAESLQELLALERLHVSSNEDAELWATLDGLGLFSIGLEEAQGGAGLGAAEEALIVMELGRRLVSPS